MMTTQDQIRFEDAMMRAKANGIISDVSAQGDTLIFYTGISSQRGTWLEFAKCKITNGHVSTKAMDRLLRIVGMVR